MKPQLAKISSLKSNPNNPRTIKDAAFDRLVESIKSFPEMLEARPIVVNSKKIILGGNRRVQAAKVAGLKEIPIKVVYWTEDQEREFTIKDNVSSGDWDFDILRDDWDNELLDEWGVGMPIFAEFEEPIEDEVKEKTQFKIEVICKSAEAQEKLYNKFIADGYECRLKT